MSVEACVHDDTYITNLYCCIFDYAAASLQGDIPQPPPPSDEKGRN